MKELECLIDHLVGESIHLLKAHLEETNSTHPTDFSERVERILCNRNGLEKTWVGLATELRWVDEEEKQAPRTDDDMGQTETDGGVYTSNRRW